MQDCYLREDEGGEQLHSLLCLLLQFLLDDADAFIECLYLGLDYLQQLLVA